MKSKYFEISMKKLLVVLFITFATTLQAKNYYISAAGNDANDGLTTSTPWKTINKVNSFSFSSSDYILFRRGDTFYGGIVVKNANLNYDAYGTGAKPVITGLSTVTGWVNLGGNIWEAPVVNVKSGVNLVLRAGLIQQVGRYPNSDAPNGGYLTYTAATSTSITGPALSSTTNWTGAEVTIRINRWEIRRQIVTSHSSGVVSFASNTTPRLNFGYFFQRDKRTLDKDGEWWHDATNKKLRMYFSSNNPSSYTIQIATIDTLFKSLQGGLLISNLSFNGSGKKAIWINGGSGVSIKNCDVNNSGAAAITTWFTSNVTVDNCTTNNSLGSGIRVYNTGTGTQNLSVTNCNVDSTALIAGMETSNENNGGAGILCYGGNGLVVQKNIITNCGYIGIHWQGNDVYIKYNYVDKICMVRDDGGGIYTVENGGSTLPVRFNRNVISNIVLNAIGANNGSDNAKSTSAKGLYFDLGTRNVLIDSNTVANNKGGAFHGNNNSSLTITNNVFYNNGKSYSLQRFADGPLVRNMVIKKNIVYPYRFEYRNLGINVPSLITKEADILAMGLIDSNYYSLRNVDTSLTCVTTNGDLSNYKESAYDVSYLNGTIGVEKHSKNVINNGTFEYNASSAPRVVQFNGLSKKDVFGTVYNNSVSIPAWSSKVLLDNGTTATINKAPLANAGIDKIITLPTDTTTLTGSGTDTDGTISSYEWIQLSGPSSTTITTTNTAVTAISKLIQGVYQYQLTVTDNGGAIAKDTVKVTVNAASLLPAVNLLPAINPASTVNGLEYKYYEGNWTSLPSFSALIPVKTGVVTNFDLSVANRVLQTGFSFTGYINVPADGQYTFYTSSDDGSNLYIDNVLTVTNDGIHGTIEKSGSIGLKAGKHAITGLFFQQSGGQVFVIKYEGNGIVKQTIPTSALYRDNLLPAINPTNIINGLDYKYYEGSWTVLPDFSTLTHIKAGATTNFNLTLANRTSQYGFNFWGYINIPIDGQYKFYTSSDDGSKLYIDKVLIVSNDSIHGTIEKSGSIGLKAGKHAINGIFFQQSGGAVFNVSYESSTIAKQTIPSSVLYRDNAAVARIANGTSVNSSSAQSISNISNITSALKITSFPNPTISEFRLFVEGGTNEKIEILVMDMNGSIVFQTQGTSNKTYKFGNSFMRGVYIIKTIQGNAVQILKVIKG